MKNSETMTLRQWQQALCAVCEGELNTGINDWINDPDNSRERLHAYRNNTLGAQLSVFEQTFPLLLKLLGADYLRQCLRAFLQTAKTNNDLSPYRGDLNELSVNVPQYLAELQRLRPELASYPWLSDLARVELQYHSAYYSEDDPLFNFEQFQNNSDTPAHIYLQLSYSLSVYESQWSIETIFSDIKNNRIGEDYPQLSQTLCVFRRDQQIHLQPLDDEERNLLIAIQSNNSLQEILKTSARCDAILPTFFSNGWINGFTLIPNTPLNVSSTHV